MLNSQPIQAEWKTIDEVSISPKLAATMCNLYRDATQLRETKLVVLRHRSDAALAMARYDAGRISFVFVESDVCGGHGMSHEMYMNSLGFAVLDARRQLVYRDPEVGLREACNFSSFGSATWLIRSLEAYFSRGCTINDSIYLDAVRRRLEEVLAGTRSLDCSGSSFL